MRLSRLISVLCAGAFAVAVVAASTADARVGGGGSSGSRGGRTFSAPPSTTTAPSGGSIMQRSVTQPNVGTNVARPANQPAGGGLFNRPGGLFGGGLLGGLAMGFLGAGLFGLLMGNGLLGGLGGLASIFGLLLQIAIVGGIVWFAWSWWQRRQQPALAQAAGPQPSYREMFGGGGNGAAAPSGGSRPADPTDDIGISPADYDAFEKLLGDVQAAYSNEDITALRKYATPEMLSYFAEDLAENTSRGVVNRISDVKLLQGDLAEAWLRGGR